MATTKLSTVEEIEQLPDDEYRYALIKGELYRMPPPMGLHGLVVLAICWHFYGFVKVLFDSARRYPFVAPAVSPET